MMLFITPNTKEASRIGAACGTDVELHHFEESKPRIREVLRFLEAHEVDIILLGPDIEEGLAHDLTEAIAARFPIPGIVLYANESADAIKAAMRAGASDVVAPESSSEEVAQVINQVRERVESRRLGSSIDLSGESLQSRVITVASPRGGVGRTLVATSLAVTLERHAPGEVVLVDLDLQCGDIAAMLELDPHLSIASLAGRGEELDSADVKALLVEDEEGLRLLAAPRSLTASVEVQPELVAAVLKQLSTSFRFVVIDTGTYISEVSLAAFDVTSDLVLVTAPDVPSVRALSRATDALDELRVNGPTRHLVVNKASGRYGMPLRDIESVSGMSAIAQVPAAKEVAMALNRGTSFREVVHPRSVIPRALKDLIKQLDPDADEPSPVRRGFLGLGR